jgi:hypothetical protein
VFFQPARGLRSGEIRPTYGRYGQAIRAGGSVESHGIATGTLKTGYMIESMVTATMSNIWRDINNEEPEAVATWNAFCLADMGYNGATFIALPACFGLSEIGGPQCHHFNTAYQETAGRMDLMT